MDVKDHIFQKVQVELTTPSKDKDREQSEYVQESVQRSLQKLDPILEKAAGDSMIKIDSVSIELTLSSNEFERLEELLDRELRAKFQDLTEEKTKKIVQDSGILSEQISEFDKNWETLSYFLETGHLPWWIQSDHFAELERWMEDLSAKDWQNLLKPLIKNGTESVTRFLVQFPDSRVDSMIQKIGLESIQKEQITRLKDELLRFSENLKINKRDYNEIKTGLRSIIIRGLILGQHVAELTTELLRMITFKIRRVQSDEFDFKKSMEGLKNQIKESKHSESDFWIVQLDNIISDLSRVEVQKKPDLFSKEMKKDIEVVDSPISFDSEKMRVQSAGIILLHPFIEKLFKNLGFTENGKFVNEGARERAVCNIHYLATGYDEFPEYELILPKFLCGWPVDQTIHRYLTLTESEKAECDSVLLSCINHWEALKSTSPEGLRNNFFQREGILKREEFGWSLYVEKKAFDILLDQLPWNLSIIKLKFMEHKLTIHWH